MISKSPRRIGQVRVFTSSGRWVGRIRRPANTHDPQRRNGEQGPPAGNPLGVSHFHLLPMPVDGHKCLKEPAAI